MKTLFHLTNIPVTDWACVDKRNCVEKIFLKHLKNKIKRVDGNPIIITVFPLEYSLRLMGHLVGRICYNGVLGKKNKVKNLLLHAVICTTRYSWLIWGKLQYRETIS